MNENTSIYRPLFMTLFDVVIDFLVKYRYIVKACKLNATKG